MMSLAALQGLTSVFSGQKELMDKYRELKRIPVFPFEEINTPDHQTFLKQLIGCINEELSEAHFDTQELDGYFGKLNGMNDEESLGKILGKLSEYNVELIDAFTFLIELLMYCNVTEEDILGYYEVILRDANLLDAFYFKDSSLQTVMATARHQNIYDGWTENQSGARKIMGREILGNKDPRVLKKSHIGPVYLEYEKVRMWDVTYALGQVGNLLKNNYWKQSITDTNMDAFYPSLMGAFMSFMKLMDFAGFTEDTLVDAFLYKNKINIERTKNGY